MSTTQRGRYQVDVGLPSPARLAPGQRPGRALALGKAGGIFRAGIALTGEYRADIALLAGLGQGLVQVRDQAVGVLPDLLLATLLILEDDLDAGQQHRLGAQQALQLVTLDLGTIEIFAVRPGPHQGAGGAGANTAGHGQGLDHLAVGKGHTVQLAIALDEHLQPARQGVGHRHADAMQATGKGISAADLFVELTAGVQAGEHHLHRRHALGRVDADRDAAAIIFDRD